ncbi:MAG: alanine--tRNA ligase [Bacteroidales bacterium]|nr:alanine--tRNA ligase [Bacteroidales bacterium]
MNSKEIRSAFLDFFESKGHEIVPSAPMVIKNDPTLMFTNAGMNQFKDYFLGNRVPDSSRVADSQKCLRVTGKHNDLEEVGHDTYHHTMFEMLGNWSFGDYFKKEAISWAWEFLTEIMKLESGRFYVTIFEGDKDDKLQRDNESFNHWREYLPEERILNGNKKDNFWEMGNTGPCGPCSEIHIDLRDNESRNKQPGSELINKNHPLVIEVWNLVFIQYNRKADSTLELLPEKHVDTGMGFERLCMAIQSKKSNYDTDLFRPIIENISELSGFVYGEEEATDVAMRVIADHLRAISFSVADGQLPSNNKAGYVVRRILRRAIRYAYTYLGKSEPFIYKLVPSLIEVMGESYPELSGQKDLIEKVIFEEEQSFLNTLENGIRRLNQMTGALRNQQNKELGGKEAFELYDTYGFPLDLTELILREKNMTVDSEGFDQEMKLQQQRSKAAAKIEKDDWVILEDSNEERFVGYDKHSDDIRIIRYRKIKTREGVMYQLVFNVTPFYAESGGQVGDTGTLENDREKVKVLDTQKENDLIIHYVKELPRNLQSTFRASVNESERTETAGNHTATHLLHYALRKLLGEHVEQKGSLVNSRMLRFDFSHFQKVSHQELRKVEKLVNLLIRQNIPVEEMRSIPMTKAKNMGAISLFGEKYGDNVRVIRFGDSVELCGGTHARATGQLGIFKVVKESSIAAGIRRIEAVTGVEAEKYINSELDQLSDISRLLEKKTNLADAVMKLVKDNVALSKEVEGYKKEVLKTSINTLKNKAEKIGEINFISAVLDSADADLLRDAAYKLRDQVENLFLVLGSKVNNKALLVVMISDKLISDKGLNASVIIREISGEIKGGGGGQPFFATAGGKNPEGLQSAMKKARNLAGKS